MSDAPRGWTIVPLGELCFRIVDGSHNPPKAVENGVYMLSARNIANRKINFEEYRFISASDFAIENERTQVQAGDVLLTIVGAIGRIAVVPDGIKRFSLQRSVAVLKSNGSVLPRYLAYAIEAPEVQQFLNDNAKGTAQKGIYLKALGRLQLPLAPLGEQERLANKLDSLTQDIDACRARMDRVPQILKKFREAVLEAAVSGKLTEEWRNAKNLPAEWPTAKFEELGRLGRGKSKHRPRNDPRLYGGPYPFIQTGDVAQSKGIVVQHSQTYSEFGLAQSQLWPADTLCITIAANIADTAMLTYPACFPDSVVGFVGDKSKCVPLFVKWCIDVSRRDLDSFAPATAQKNINLAVLNALELPSPTIAEQTEIVRRVSYLLAHADNLDHRYATAAAQVERLTPSVLAKAFRGELVSQDTNDEPAEAMLERIRRARSYS